MSGENEQKRISGWFAGVVMANKFTKVKFQSFRKYVSNVKSRAVIQGKISNTNNMIQYRIGVGAKDGNHNLLNPLSYSINGGTMQKFRYIDSIRDELDKVNRKVCALSPCYKYGDLSAVGYVLARAFSYYSLFGILNPKQLSGDMPLKIESLDTQLEPLCANASSIFISKKLMDQKSPHVFAALVLAANCCGVTVITDHLEVNANNSAILKQPKNEDLAFGCLQGMRILMSMYSVCDSGSMMAMAITCGFHRVTTVCGHTDEGSFFRTVLRKVKFCKPYGAIHVPVDYTYSGIPMPCRGSKASFQATNDSICLVTAGLVAISDPLMECEQGSRSSLFVSENSVKTKDLQQFGTKYFRELLTKGKTDDFADAIGKFKKVMEETKNKGNDKDARSIINQIDDDCTDFCREYIKNLSLVFLVQGGEDSAVDLLINAFSSCTETIIDCLKAKIVAPFYWIEPTTLFASRIKTKANDEGLGVIVGTEEEDVKMNMFERMITEFDNTMYVKINAKFSCARKCGMIMHHLNNKKDGLASLKLEQCKYDHVTLKGGTDSLSDDIENNATIDKMLWTRGDCRIPAPAEFNYFGEGMKFRLDYAKIDEDNEFTEMHVKSSDELSDPYSFSCCRPMAMDKLDSKDDILMPKLVIKELNTITKAIRKIRKMRFGCFNNVVDSQIGGDRDVTIYSQKLLDREIYSEYSEHRTSFEKTNTPSNSIQTVTNLYSGDRKLKFVDSTLRIRPNNKKMTSTEKKDKIEVNIEEELGPDDLTQNDEQPDEKTNDSPPVGNLMG